MTDHPVGPRGKKKFITTAQGFALSAGRLRLQHHLIRAQAQERSDFLVAVFTSRGSACYHLQPTQAYELNRGALVSLGGAYRVG